MGTDGFVDLNANPLVVRLGKPPGEFQRKDLIQFIAEDQIRAIHFRYAGGDGRLKELKLPVNNRRDLEVMLAEGERVDGSSLFKGIMLAESSDLYAVPVYRSAFVDPFDPTTLHLFCRFFDHSGEPFAHSPANILARAAEQMREKTGVELHALGELEFFLILDPTDQDLFPPTAQAAYHESAPYTKGDLITSEILRHAARITTGHVKYCHAEVGAIDSLESQIKALAGKRLEQHELEFLPAPVEDTADFLVTCQWLIRRVAAQYGAGVTFAPKLDDGIAGNGLHIHMAGVRDGRNAMLDDGALSEVAKRMIAGTLKHAASLTGFGNTVASAYLRLVPGQEAPTRICWSERNRSALVRVPLAWGNTPDMASRVNPEQSAARQKGDGLQTVEFRAPDGSADIYLLLAGLCKAVTDGLTAANSLERAKQLHVQGNFLQDAAVAGSLDALPASCHASAGALEADRTFYEADGVFPPAVIDFALRRLRENRDESLNAELDRLADRNRAVFARKIMHRVALRL